MNELKADVTDVDNQRQLYHKHGLFYVDGLFPEPILTRWANVIYRDGSGKDPIQRTSEEEDPEKVYSEGADYKVIDGVEVAKNAALADMLSFYHTLRPWLSAVTHRKIITSPYERSSINCKVYPELGGHQEWHYDTNGLTFLLYLTDNFHGEGATEAYPLTARKPMGKSVANRFDGESVLVEPRRGRVLIMNGREVWHKSCPVGPRHKISCPWNYYEEGDVWRPEGFDTHTSGK